MANIQERRDKSGKLISFSIRVFRGRGDDGKQLKPYTATFEVKPTWNETSARKKAEAFAATFEKECREGTATDTRLKFSVYADYVLDLKEKRNLLKHSTLVRYKELTKRVYPEIGHIKLRDLRVDHLNALYTKLGAPGEKNTSAKAKSKIDLSSCLKDAHKSRAQVARECGLAASTVEAAVNAKSVSRTNAEKICNVLGVKYENAFLTITAHESLAAKTIIEYHRFISAVLEQASDEGLIPFNIASKATLPKLEHKKANYFQPEQIRAIRDALENEPMKWKTLTHLFLISGARRGEVLGIKWQSVDFDNNRIHIENSVLYTVERGVYEDSPKTENSVRWVSLPAETMSLLHAWKEEQEKEKQRLEGYYFDRGFVFSQDNGQPMHPDSVTIWMRKFAERHGLPHINPHAFRHTMASLLYFNHVDTISISKRLGHAQPSTTANIYAHVIEEADRMNADILGDIFLKKA